MPEIPQSLTCVLEGAAPILLSEAWVLPSPHTTREDIDKIKPYQAMWDTGAFQSAISPKAARSCNLNSVGVQQITTAGGIRYVKTYLVSLILPNYLIFPNATVLEIDLAVVDVLIGMDIIGRGDFAVSQSKGNTCFSYRMPSQGPIDFTLEY